MLSRKYVFSGYRQTRVFLDNLADWSKQTGLHPHTINFGATHVNLTIEGEGEMPGADAIAMAECIEDIFLNHNRELRVKEAP